MTEVVDLFRQSDCESNRILTWEEVRDETAEFAVDGNVLLPAIFIIRSFNHSCLVTRVYRSSLNELRTEILYNGTKHPGFVAPLDWCINDKTGFTTTLTITYERTEENNAEDI